MNGTWTEIGSVSEWMARWDENFWTVRSRETAISLLWVLPNLAVIPSQARDDCGGDLVASIPWMHGPEYEWAEKRRLQGLKDFLTVLHRAIDITLRETDSQVANYATRAVYQSIVPIKGWLDVGRLPGIDVQNGPSSFDSINWDWPDYRSLALKLFDFFSSARSYPGLMTQHWKIAGSWLHILLSEANDRRRPSSLGQYNTRAFDWPDYQAEHNQTKLLQTAVMARLPGTNIHRPEPYEFEKCEDLIDGYFRMLVDARDHCLSGNKSYSRKPVHQWPDFTKDHVVAIHQAIYFLGVKLHKPFEEIEPAPYEKK